MFSLIAHHLCWGPLPDGSFPITPGSQPILCEIWCRQTKTFQRCGTSQEVFHRRDRSQGKDRWMRNWSHRETGLCLSEGQVRAAMLHIPSLLFRACKDMVFALHGSPQAERKWKSRVPQESRWGTWVRSYHYTWRQRAPRSLNPDVIPEGKGRSRLVLHSQTFPLGHHREGGA